jgi:AcrR family transcriptional regulator
VDDLLQNSKYQDIFRTAKELFWKYGIKRVTIEEICREAGVSKMTFYKFFPNKIELAKMILDAIVDKSIAKLEQLIDNDIPFSQKMEELFLLKLEGIKDISIEFFNDIYKNPESGLMAHMEKQKQKSMSVIVDFYKTAQENGSIRKNIKIDFILAISQHMMKVLEDEQLVGQYEQPQDLIIESMNLLFYGIVTGNE